MRERAKIGRLIGEVMTFTGGEERCSPRVEVVQSNYHDAEPGDGGLRLTNNEGQVFEVSLNTLKEIVGWAELESQ